MESIKKQSLHATNFNSSSDFDFDSDSQWFSQFLPHFMSIPSVWNPSQKEDDTFVAPLVTLELSKQFGDWQQLSLLGHEQQVAPFGKTLPHSSTSALPMYLMYPCDCFVLVLAISAETLRHDDRRHHPESMITSSCITNFLSNIFRRLPPWVKFICCHCGASDS